MQGDFIAPPRSNVVMQSVVLGRRHPRLFGIDSDDYDYDDDRLREIIRRFLRRRRVSSIPLPYKKTELDEKDTETLDNDILERMVSAVKKSKTKRIPERSEDEDVEVERLVDGQEGLENPRRHSKLRSGRKKRDYWRRNRIEDEDTTFARKRRPLEEEEDEEVEAPRRRYKSRRVNRRRDWENLDEERRRKASEEDWGSAKKNSYYTKNTKDKDILYLPPQWSQSRHWIRPRSSDEYLR